MLREVEVALPHKMPRQTKRKSEVRKLLKERMQIEFRNLYKYGRRARTSDVVAAIESEHPELVQEISDDLTTRTLQVMAAEVAGTWSAVAEKGERQLILPGMETELVERLPPALSIPVDGSVHQIEFVPAQVATFAEWMKHLDYLLSQYKGLGIVIAVIREVIERGNEAACPGDAPLLLWLSEQASSPPG
jgi:hypothetical protein